MKGLFLFIFFTANCLCALSLQVLAQTQTPKEYFFAMHKDTSYLYHSLGKHNLLYRLQYVGSLANDTEKFKQVRATYVLTNLAGNYHHHHVAEGDFKATWVFDVSDFKIEMKEEHIVNKLDKNKVKEVAETQVEPYLFVSSRKYTTGNATADGKTIRHTFEVFSSVKFENHTYKDVVVHVYTTVETKTDKLISREKYYFGKGSGLIRYEKYDKDGHLVVDESFQLKKIEVHKHTH
jgi:hypothetical protein